MSACPLDGSVRVRHTSDGLTWWTCPWCGGVEDDDETEGETG